MKSFVKNYGWREKQGEIFLKKRKSNVLKLHSAKKLLTLSKRQFLLLPKCTFSVLLQRCVASTGNTDRPEKGMRHSTLQVINPRVCTLLITAPSWTLLRRMSSSKKALILSSSVKGQYLTPNSAYS